MNKKKQAVIMGGGTGTFPVVRAMKHLHVDITSLIAVSDSGGSTGRIRDEFGFQPVGDLRQALAALAESKGEEWIRKILLYRFTKGKGLEGHNLGNLLLTALQDMTSDTTKALEIAEKIFRLNGRVIPITQDNVHLKIIYADGKIVIGEHTLDQNNAHAQKIARVELTPPAQINPLAAEAIASADIIVIGPGDYYASLMATLIADGVKLAFNRSQAKIVYIVNLMTRSTQTRGMTAQAHVEGIEAAIGRKLGFILCNSQPIDQRILGLYAREGEYPVVDDLHTDKRVVRGSLLCDQVFETVASDTAHRSLLRHDEKKIETILKQILRESTI